MNNCAVGARFCHIDVCRDHKTILEDVSAEIPCGSASVIIGPNGAGKTTLLRCLLGEMAHQGTIEFFNESGQPVKPTLAYVPQIVQADANMPLRVYEFLALARNKKPLWLGCSHKTRAENRKLLEMVEAANLEEQYLGNLSGGEMRRVLLASALGRKPGLLALDEAEAGVDYKGERLFWRLLDEMRRTMGFTLLMVSHNLPLAAHYASNILCIKKKLLAEGPPACVLTSAILQELFGVPIHLYPEQCDEDEGHCPNCGARGLLPHQGLMDVSQQKGTSCDEF